MTPRPPDRVWVDRLSRESVRAAVEICRQKGIARIEYLEWPTTVHEPVPPGSLDAGLTLQPIDGDLSTLRYASGRGIRYELNEVVVSRVPETLRRRMAATGLGDSTPRLTPDEVFAALLRSAVVNLVYPSAALALLAAARSDDGSSPIILIDAAAGALVGDWPECRGCVVQTYNVRRSAAARCRAALGGGLRAVKELLGLHLRGIASSAPADGAPRIALQLLPHVKGEPLWYPWYEDSGIDGSQVCVYADRPDFPITADARAAIARNRHAWIDFRAGAGAAWGRPYVADARATLGESLRIVRLAMRGSDPFVAWESVERQRLLWRVAFWESLFRRHRIAALLQVGETEPLTIAQAAAVRRAGGISVGWHWSHYQFASAMHTRCGSTYFSWGPFYRALFVREPMRVTQLVYAGHMPGRPAKHPALAPADQLRRAGATYVVCYFDTSVWAQSRRSVLDLYARLLTHVARTPGFGLIIKSKKGVPLDIPELRDADAAARATGRVLELSPETSSQDAAAAADLVVGHGINTAALEAAFDGRRAIYADLDGDAANAFYAWGRNTVVFDSLDGVMNAIERHRLEGDASAIGDHRAMPATINLFGDHAGHRRAGWYLKTYLDDLSRHGDTARAHRHAGAEYQRRFGAASVVFDAEGAGVRILGLIPARGGSRRLPGKNLQPLGGRPLIAWTIDAAKRSRAFDRIVVSTDDEAIAAVAAECGADVPFVRPPQLATDAASSADVVRHALDALRAQGYVPDILFLLQPTSPFRLPEDIDTALALLAERGADAVLGATAAAQNHASRWRVNGNGWAARIDAAGSPSSGETQYAINGAIYAVRTEAFLREQTLFPARSVLFVMPPERSLDIDVPVDLQRAESMAAAR
ncbi:MAG: acylneuraminate cytidylyltransferase family protein [Acidobacteriia bacterium]|nr:acylneuraminate cytidylyltransferase family protein [Terriglobia bacterium]